KVQTANSAKKLRLTKVDAGCGPWGKKPKATQNCSAAQSAATTAPACTPQASIGIRSRDSVLTPSQTSRLKTNQRTTSVPARYVCDQKRLPTEYPISSKGSHITACQRSASWRS